MNIIEDAVQIAMVQLINVRPVFVYQRFEFDHKCIGQTCFGYYIKKHGYQRYQVTSLSIISSQATCQSTKLGYLSFNQSKLGRLSINQSKLGRLFINQSMLGYLFINQSKLGCLFINQSKLGWLFLSTNQSWATCLSTRSTLVSCLSNSPCKAPFTVVVSG